MTRGQVTGFAFGIGIERLAHADVRRRRHPAVLRERPPLPGAVRLLKILVSWLRELVDVPVTPAKLASDLHMAGFEVASVEPPPGAPGDGDDAVIDLEITANRPDCLSVLGIAREVATLYDTLLEDAAPVDARRRRRTDRLATCG